MAYVMLQEENSFMAQCDLIKQIREFIENEARSCSMGLGCVTLMSSIILGAYE